MQSLLAASLCTRWQYQKKKRMFHDNAYMLRGIAFAITVFCLTVNFWWGPSGKPIETTKMDEVSNLVTGRV